MKLGYAISFMMSPAFEPEPQSLASAGVDPASSTTLHTTASPSLKFSFLRFLPVKRINPYCLAVLSAVFGLVLRLAIDPWLGDQMPYITFLVAVALVGLFVAVGPALVSAALGAVIAYFCFVPPRYHWGFQGVSDAAGFFSYLGAALVIVLLTRARKEAYREAERRMQEQLAAEGKLLDTQRLFQLFMDNRPGFSYLRHRDGQYVYFNNTARLMLGNNPTLATLPEAFSELQDNDEEAVKSDRPRQFTNKIILPEGERYWLTTKFAFVDREQQAFIGSVSTDITEQVMAEEVALERERLIAAAQIVATVAHEVNNPLAAVNQSVFLLGCEALPPHARELTEIAQAELLRLVRITRLALGFYKDDEHPVALDPCEVVEDVIDGLSGRFSARKISIVRDFEWEGTVALPGQRTHEVIENILANAFESGATQIRVRVSRSNDWHASARRGCRISVLDNGIGMSPENQKQAFQPFFSTKDEKGRGLGLWISRAVVLKNGGLIRVRSTDKPSRRGTCVSIFLPDRLSRQPAPGVGIHKMSGAQSTTGTAYPRAAS